jgi:uncharacterized protein YndB with AHSA1/START domain
VIKAEERVLHLERRILAPRETVFSYFIEPEKYARWQGVDAKLDPRPGGVFRVIMGGRSGSIVSGTFQEIDPPRRLVYTWGWEPIEQLDPEVWDAIPGDMKRALPQGFTEVPPGSSTIEIVFEPDGDATILRIRHSGLPSDDAGTFHNVGWNMSLDRLVVIAAGGDAGPSIFENF